MAETAQTITMKVDARVFALQLKNAELGVALVEALVDVDRARSLLGRVIEHGDRYPDEELANDIDTWLHQPRGEAAGVLALAYHRYRDRFPDGELYCSDEFDSASCSCRMDIAGVLEELVAPTSVGRSE